MSKLKTSLEIKRTEQFYGSIAKFELQKCVNESEKSLFIKRANAFLETIIKYMTERFDFSENNKFKYLNTLNLNENPKFDEFLLIIDKFNIKNINVDVLFEEFVILKGEFDELNNHNSCEKKWMAMLNKYQMPNMEKIINFNFSIPHSNAMTERIFSLMFNAWRKERNRLSLQNLEAEIMVRNNFDLNCVEFYKLIINNDEILNQISGKEKYT